MIDQTLQKLRNGNSLSEDEMYDAVLDILEGKCSNDEIAEFLVCLADRGETIEEITGAAKVMREKVLPIDAPAGALDCCGTGGDQSGTYNISSAVAIVAAACGVAVAKHGNRSASSKSGAADVLESLGINLDVPQEKLEEAIRRFNFAFLMAPRHHAAMKYVVPVRKALARRTIFNVLGPLSNPANTKYQLLGVFDRDLVLPIAKVLKKLGTKSAWVVHGADGLDEITLTAETYVAKLEDGEITESVLTPEDFGLQSCEMKALIGGEPQDNAKALTEVLSGKKCAYRDIVVANTAAVLMIKGEETDLKEAASRAEKAIDDRSALNILDQYKRFTQEHGVTSS